MKGERSSIYPATNPPGSHVLVRTSPNEVTMVDRIAVAMASMLVVGSAMWDSGIFSILSTFKDFFYY